MYLRSISTMSGSHHGNPLVSFVSASSSSPNSACFCPIATKEFEYRRFWWNGALRNLIVERRRKNDLTCLHFSRGVVVVIVGHVPQTPFVAFYYFPASPSSRTLPPLFAFRSHLSKKYHDYFNSRWYCRPIDETSPGVILYFILSHLSHGYIDYTDSGRILKSLLTIHVR